MWWLLVVMLWPVQGDPQSLTPLRFKTAEACDAATRSFLSDIAADRPQSIAAITAKCVAFSDPMTEQRP